jgi:hypothetical protein
MSDIPTKTSSISAIELHVRSYRSALKSTLEVTINSLANSQLNMHSTLHPFGDDPQKIDISAFSYSLLRLPNIVEKTKKIIVGQNLDIFKQAGFSNVENWPKVAAQARRRFTKYNKDVKILAYFAASISDIDDLTNTLIAFQTEWNKTHNLLKLHYKTYQSLKNDLKNEKIGNKLKLPKDEWQNIIDALGKNWKLRLKRIYSDSLNLKIQLLASSWMNYTKTTQKWWKNIAKTVAPNFHISHQNIYFVSSNTHSLLNIYTGFALKHQDQIISLVKTDHPDLYQKWQQIQKKESFLDPKDFIYFAFRYFINHPQFQDIFKAYQQKLGIISIPNETDLDIDVQLFPIKNLVKSKFLDPRIKIKRPQKIANSKALIFNIDYPLGFSAYHVLTETMENVKTIKGIYILGKAAVLNGEIGDIQIPRLVFDEHTQNSYIFKNCFNTYFPFTNNQGSILTNQKAVSVLGTFLENKALLDTYSKNNLTVIEMESGPYLSAVTEATYDQQAPKNTIIDLNNAPFDIGIVNYTSDTPYSGLQTLGTSNLGLNGIEPVTLGSLAILQRIINLEEGI